MKKRITLLMVLQFTVFLIPKSYSQKGELRLAVEGGMSLPSGNYGSHTLLNNNAMFADPGGVFEPTIGYFITKNLSIDLGFSYSRNSVNDASFYNQYFSTHANSIGYNLPPKNIDYELTLPYENKGFYLGLGAHFLKGKKEKLTIQSKIQFGINSYFIGGSSSILYFDDPTPYEEREIFEVGYVSDYGFSFLFSAGIGYKFSDRLGTFVNLEYCATSYDYSVNYIRSELDNNSVYSYENDYIDFSSSVSWINLNVGLYFSIIKSKS